ncbi:MAG: membrane protein insertion efficiency factor YidD [Pseudomonadota bacterium]
MNILQRTLIAMLRFYQLTLSLVIGQRCRFYPSCSSYAMDAIRIHGALRGSVLTIKRLSRCHPFHPGGIDHVPEARPTVNADQCGPRRARPEHPIQVATE